MADDEIVLADLSDEELVEQMHDDLYDGLADEIIEGTNILLGRGWTPSRVLDEVLVAGMRAPRNLGEAYVRAYDPIFAELASKHGALLYPFYLEGVALNPQLNLQDGLHPNAKGISLIAERMAPSVEQLIGRVKAKRLARSGG